MVSHAAPIDRELRRFVDLDVNGDSILFLLGWGAGRGGRGVVAIPLVENQKVSWLLGCWFLGVKDYWFLFLGFWFLGFGFLVSEFQRFTKLTFHAFWRILISYPRFPRFY